MANNKSIVLELQLLATETDVPIAELLRKSLLIATKLNLIEFKKWINNELHGYTDSDVPDYRIIYGQLKAKNPYRGLIPFMTGDQEMTNLLSRTEIYDSIESLVDLVINRSDQGYFQIPYPEEAQRMIMQMQDSFSPLPVIRIFGPNQIVAIIDKVRTKILEWSLALEQQGILGEGLIFTEAERRKAVANTSVNIQNFQGVLGDVSGGVVNQNNSQQIISGDFSSLADHLKKNNIGDSEINDLSNAIVADGAISEKGKFGQNVSDWIGRMLAKSADGTWQVGLGAAGNLLAEALTKFYGL